MNNTQTPSIIVTGGSGMVGSSFQNVPNCLRLSSSELDVTDAKQVESTISKHNPQAIIHLAALTNVDYCQSNPAEAYQVNTIGTKNIATIAKKLGIHLLYVSTGGVFSGRSKRAYTIKSKPDPISVYTRSKYLGEIIAQDINPKTSVIRTGWIFGGYEKDKKFVSMIAKQIWSGEKQIFAVNDTYGCPTYAQDLADTLFQLVITPQYGIIHGVNKGFASRYEIAQEIVKILNPKVEVIPKSIKDFPAFPAPRPKYEIMEQSLPLRTWQAALKEYLKSWQQIR